MSASETRELRSQRDADKLQERLWRARVWLNERNRAAKINSRRYALKEAQFRQYIDV